MGNNKIKLQPGNVYHIFNRGINSCPIFTEPTNYEHFLGLYDKHISSVAETIAWVLMGNHFHLAVRILKPEMVNDEDDTKVEKRINQQFSNLFNAYTKAFNKKYQRTGSLFEHSFERKLIPDVNYLKRLVLYIHNNPVHHGFCSHPMEYPWSSYFSYLYPKKNSLQMKTAQDWSQEETNFGSWLNEEVKVDEIEKWLKM